MPVSDTKALEDVPTTAPCHKCELQYEWTWKERAQHVESCGSIWPADGILTDDETAIVTPAAFDNLGDYSCSIPTGKTIGKRWRRMKKWGAPEDGWWLCEYMSIPDDPTRLLIKCRDLVVVE